MPIKDDSLETYGRKHPVPQNVMDVEFKVVGDLTVRQLMYLFAGGILVYILLKSGLPGFWRWALMISSGGLSIAVAFVPFQERGLDRWLISFTKGIIAPNQRVWKKSYAPPIYFISDYAEIIKNEIMTLTPAKSRSKLDEYLGNLPQDQTQFEIEEQKRLRMVSDMFAIVKTSEIQKDEIESKGEFVTALETKQVDRTMTHLPSRLKGEIKIETSSSLPPAIVFEDIKELEKQEKKLSSGIEDLVKLTQKVKRQFAQKDLSPKHKKNRLAFFRRKKEELLKEKKRIAQELSTSQEKLVKYSKSSERSALEKQIENLANQNEQMEKHLKVLEKELDKLVKAQGNLQKVTPVLPDDEPREPLPSLKEKQSKPQEFVMAQTPAPPIEESKEQSQNIVHGTVKARDGQLLEGAVVIIKDHKGDVERALQTNKLGQFKTQTPLSNGKYSVEVIKGGQQFDIISIDAMGKPLQSVYLVGK